MSSTQDVPVTTSAPAEVLTAAYAAFGAADLPALGALLADDVVWRISDTGPLDGVHVGRDAVFAFLGGLMEQTGGTFSLEVRDVLSSATRAAAVCRETVSRDGQVHGWDVVHVAEVVDGRIVSFDGSSADPANAAYWHAGS